MDNVGSQEPGKPITRFEFNIVLGFLIGISVVCAIGLITLVINYFEGSKQAYENLSNQIIIEHSNKNDRTTRILPL